MRSCGRISIDGKKDKLSDLKLCPRNTIIFRIVGRYEWCQLLGEAAGQCSIECTNFVVTQAEFKTQV